MMNTGSTDVGIRESIVNILKGTNEVRLEVDWAPRIFMSEQYNSHIDLEQVLCCSGLVDASYISPIQNSDFHNLLYKLHRN